MKNFNTYTIALLLLLSAVILIVGVKYTLTDRKACKVSQPTYSLRSIQYPTTTPSVVEGHPAHQSAPSLLLPITATTPAKHYRSRTSYNAGANLSKSVSRTYTPQQLTQMSSQTMHSSAVSAIRTDGYNAAAGDASNASRFNAWYAGSDSRSTGVSSSNEYTGITASPYLAVRGKHLPRRLPMPPRHIVLPNKAPPIALSAVSLPPTMDTIKEKLSPTQKERYGHGTKMKVGYQAALPPSETRR